MLLHITMWCSKGSTRSVWSRVNYYYWKQTLLLMYSDHNGYLTIIIMSMSGKINILIGQGCYFYFITLSIHLVTPFLAVAITNFRTENKAVDVKCLERLLETGIFSVLQCNKKRQERSHCICKLSV